MVALAVRETKAQVAIEWLLSSRGPAIRHLVRRDIIGKTTGDPEDVLSGPIARGPLHGQCADGGFGVHPYKKWGGAHWRLVSLVELGIPSGDTRARAAAETVLGWLTGSGHRRGTR